MHVTGYGLVLLMGAIGWWLMTRKGRMITGGLFIAAAGLCLVGTAAGPHIFDGIQTGVNGISTGIDQATSR
jgi:hypothetical protein